MWESLCRARWPAVASAPALARIVTARGARAYYRARVEADIVEPLTPPLLDLDDLLFTVDVSQGGKVLSSVACEARDAMRHDLEDHDCQFYDGICLDGLRARIDCSADKCVPPYKNPFSIAVCVVRKSDGRVSPLIPRTDHRNGGGYQFGSPSMRMVSADQTLRGMMPFYISDPINALQECQRADLPKDWRLRKILPNARWDSQSLECKISIGTCSEFPNGMRADTWSPSPDPSVVIGDDYFEIRRICLFFHLFLYKNDYDDMYCYPDGSDIQDIFTLGVLHRVLSERLAFR